MTQLTKPKLEEMYSRTGSIREMARLLNVDPKTVSREMRKLDINYSSVVRKHPVNHEFFSQPTEISLYWAGFIAANGNISTYDSAYRIEMNIALQDKDHLVRMVSDLGTTVPVKKTRTARADGAINDHVRCVVSSKYLVTDLIDKYTITPRKKLTYAMPEWLIHHSDVRHFIRGWVDGIGGYYCHNEQVYFNTRGTRLMISQIIKILSKSIGLKDDSYTVKPIDRGPLQQLHIVGRDTLENLFEFLYADCTVFLERKRNEALYLRAK